MRRQQDEGLKFWCAPRENEKPFTEPERAQRWRLSLASLLFITVLLSDHLWFCAEATLTRTRDKRPAERLAGIADMGESANPLQRHRTPTSADGAHRTRLSREQDDIFLGNSTLGQMDTCQPGSPAAGGDSLTLASDACLTGLSGGAGTGSRSARVNMSDLYLSFCNSYSLLDLFYGFTSLNNTNCTLDMAIGMDQQECRRRLRAYQELDRQAEERYQEFELLVQKYETDQYSVRTCMEECKVKIWGEGWRGKRVSERASALGHARPPTYTLPTSLPSLDFAHTHARTHAPSSAFKGVGTQLLWQPLGFSVSILMHLRGSRSSSSSGPLDFLGGWRPTQCCCSTTLNPPQAALLLRGQI